MDSGLDTLIKVMLFIGFGLGVCSFLLYMVSFIGYQDKRLYRNDPDAGEDDLPLEPDECEFAANRRALLGNIRKFGNYLMLCASAFFLVSIFMVTRLALAGDHDSGGAPSGNVAAPQTTVRVLSEG